MTMIPMKKAVDVIIGYLAGEVSKIQNMTDRFLFYACLGVAKANPEAIVGNVAYALEKMGAVDASGNLSLESMKSAFDMAFANVPNFRFMGFTFTSADADEIMRRMEA